jgi:hypothetical protein
MTYVEFMAWVEYRRKRGPLNPMLRQDWNFAVLQTQVNRACGGKAELADFMPWAKDDDPDASVGDVMTILTGATKTNG